MTRRLRAPNNGAGRREAEAQLDTLAASMAMDTDGMTVAEFLDAYELACEASWAPSTRAAFPYHADAFRREIGDRPVAGLRSVDLDTLYGRWLSDGDGEAPAFGSGGRAAPWPKVRCGGRVTGP